jgi:hydroxyethylthiazole kinase-like uncharacterized protein yjeF
VSHLVNRELLAARPLPRIDHDATKHDRGSILVAGGSDETPGAVVLAAIAALRSGAGRMRIATTAAVAPAVAVAVPEARVTGSLAPDTVADLTSRCAAVLLGPGMLDVDEAEAVVDAVTAAMDEGFLVLDAGALPAAGRHPEWIHRLDGRALLIPNPGELEALGCEDAPSAAVRLRATVAVRGAESVIATPDGEVFVDRHGTPGLATSGSGDVAAGIIAGFATLGADPVTAAIWGVAVHGLAGERLGPTGFLARELLDVIREVRSELDGGELGDPAAGA